MGRDNNLYVIPNEVYQKLLDKGPNDYDLFELIQEFKKFKDLYYKNEPDFVCDNKWDYQKEKEYQDKMYALHGWKELVSWRDREARDAIDTCKVNYVHYELGSDYALVYKDELKLFDTLEDDIKFFDKEKDVIDKTNREFYFLHSGY